MFRVGDKVKFKVGCEICHRCENITGRKCEFGEEGKYTICKTREKSREVDTLVNLSIIGDCYMVGVSIGEHGEEGWCWHPEDNLEPCIKVIKPFGIVKFCKEQYK